MPSPNVELLFCRSSEARHPSSHSFPLKMLLKNVARERIKDLPTFRDYLEVKVGRHGSPWSFFVRFRGKISLKCFKGKLQVNSVHKSLCELNHWSWSGFNCVSCFLWGCKEVCKMG